MPSSSLSALPYPSGSAAPDAAAVTAVATIAASPASMAQDRSATVGGPWDIRIHVGIRDGSGEERGRRHWVCRQPGGRSATSRPSSYGRRVELRSGARPASGAPVLERASCAAMMQISAAVPNTGSITAFAVTQGA